MNQNYAKSTTKIGLENSDSPVQIAANTADNYYHHANTKYYELQDVEGALADYDRAIELNPNHALAYSNRGNVKKDCLQDDRGALADYDRALELNPNDAVTCYNRARLKQIERDDRGALVDYDRAISIDPLDADSYHNRALLKYLELDDLESAVVDMQAASKLYQDQENLGQYQQAIDLLQQFRLEQLTGLSHKDRKPKIVILDLTCQSQERIK